MWLDLAIMRLLFIPLLCHSLVLLISQFQVNHNQFDDYGDLPLPDGVENAETIDDLGYTKLDPPPPEFLDEMLFCYYTVIPFLRIIALCPAFFYLIGTLLYMTSVSDPSMIKGNLDIGFIVNTLIGVSAVAHATYVGVKLVMNTHLHLKNYHPDYGLGETNISRFLDHYPSMTDYNDRN